MKIEIENREPNYKEVADTIRLGPQKEILDDLDVINNRWMMTNWVYGNRSELEPLEPLHVTKMFRWGAGYKQKILECIDTRFTQYSKPSSSIQTIFSRANNSEWYKKQFIEKVVDLDEKLKRLRQNKLSFDSNEDVFKDVYKKFLTHYDMQKHVAETMSNDDIEIEIDMYRIPSNKLEDLSINSPNNRELTQSEKDCISYEQTYVYQRYTWKKPVMDFVDRNGVTVYSHQLPEPIHMTFYFKVSEIVNKMIHCNGDIRQITSSNLNSNNNYHDRYQNSLSQRAGIGCTSIWGSGGGYDGTLERMSDPLNISSNYSSSYTVTAYPYIGIREYVMPSGVGEYIDYDKKHWNNVCHGDLTSEFNTCFLQMDVFGILSLFSSWNVWHTTRSNPLQGISYMFLEKRPEMAKIWEQVGFNHTDAHRRLSMMYQCFLGHWDIEVCLRDNYLTLITHEYIEDKVVQYLENEKRCMYDQEYTTMWLDKYDVGAVDWYEEFLAEHIINARHAMMAHSSSYNCLEYDNVSRESDTMAFIEWISTKETLDYVDADELDVIPQPFNLPEFDDGEYARNADSVIDNIIEDNESQLESIIENNESRLEREMLMWVNANTRRTNNG
jgi:hypothetical protein